MSLFEFWLVIHPQQHNKLRGSSTRLFTTLVSPIPKCFPERVVHLSTIDTCRKKVSQVSFQAGVHPQTRLTSHFINRGTEDLRDELRDVVNETVAAYKEYDFSSQVWTSLQWPGWQNEIQYRYEEYTDASARFSTISAEIMRLYGYAGEQFCRKHRNRLNSRLRYYAITRGRF
jgi:hypothetical protein